jgi:hypothetical protein
MFEVLLRGGLLFIVCGLLFHPAESVRQQNRKS